MITKQQDCKRSTVQLSAESLASGISNECHSKLSKWGRLVEDKTAPPEAKGNDYFQYWKKYIASGRPLYIPISNKVLSTKVLLCIPDAACIMTMSILTVAKVVSTTKQPDSSPPFHCCLFKLRLPFDGCLIQDVLR